MKEDPGYCPPLYKGLLFSAHVSRGIASLPRLLHVLLSGRTSGGITVKTSNDTHQALLLHTFAPKANAT
eukprot:5279560-Amphidinium_carterae.1